MYRLSWQIREVNSEDEWDERKTNELLNALDADGIDYSIVSGIEGEIPDKIQIVRRDRSVITVGYGNDGYFILNRLGTNLAKRWTDQDKEDVTRTINAIKQLIQYTVGRT